MGKARIAEAMMAEPPHPPIPMIPSNFLSPNNCRTSFGTASSKAFMAAALSFVERSSAKLIPPALATSSAS